MGKKPELLPGTHDLLILNTLSRGSLHGYEMAASIKCISGDVPRWKKVLCIRDFNGCCCRDG